MQRPSGRECYVLDSVGLIQACLCHRPAARGFMRPLLSCCQGLPINVCEAVQATVQDGPE